MQPSISSDDNQKNDETEKYCSIGRMAGKSLHAIAQKKMYQMEMVTGRCLRQASAQAICVVWL